MKEGDIPLKLSDLDFAYPEELVATEPSSSSRVLWTVGGKLEELSINALLSRIPAGDLVVLNDTRVLRRRVRSNEGIEILFIRKLSEAKLGQPEAWEVLMPARRLKTDEFVLPEQVHGVLQSRSRPQKIEVSRPLSESYFHQHGVVGVPPYIQQARETRNKLKRQYVSNFLDPEQTSRSQEESWYQTDWGDKPGSLASPTASLHFRSSDFEALRARGVGVEKLTLHIGTGTFLPIDKEQISEHIMHEEWIEISQGTIEAIKACKKRGSKIWALGTTVTRSLESYGCGLLKPDQQGGFSGKSDLFIYPGYEFKYVDYLMTNFHQPRSTLLALLCAFSSREDVLSAYQWAIERKFRLFSYGDLSVWRHEDSRRPKL